VGCGLVWGQSPNDIYITSPRWRETSRAAGGRAGLRELAGPDPEDTPIGVKIHINASAIMAISVIN